MGVNADDLEITDDTDTRGDRLLDDEADIVICTDSLLALVAVTLTIRVTRPLYVETPLLSDVRMLLLTHADTVPVAESLETVLIERELVAVDEDV